MSNESSEEVIPNVTSLAEWVLINNSETGTAPPKPLEKSQDKNSISSEYIIAAYYFPAYHPNPQNSLAHGPGWTEWSLLEHARPRFPGHKQPKIPLWGYEDDSFPTVFAKKIEAAKRGGVGTLIFDWYWYDTGPFLNAALEEGFLGAKKEMAKDGVEEGGEEVTFALMWANHDWVDIHPAKLTAPPNLQYPGQVTPETFDKLTTYVVDNYFSQPSYLKIDGCPYFSIYELYRFVSGIGGSSAAASALQSFRSKTKNAGFKDLHLNAVTFGIQLLPGEGEPRDLKTLLQELGVDSTTSYVWIHHVELATFPVTQYEDLRRGYEAYREGAEEQLGKPYFPNVSVGWDSSPRACQSDVYVKSTYPFLPVVEGNSPEQVGEALRNAKEWLDRDDDKGEKEVGSGSVEGKTKMLTINSWNEWTEGSYMEPDTENEFGYLDKIREVFFE